MLRETERAAIKFCRISFPSLVSWIWVLLSLKIGIKSFFVRSSCPWKKHAIFPTSQAHSFLGVYLFWDLKSMGNLLDILSISGGTSQSCFEFWSPWKKQGNFPTSSSQFPCMSWDLKSKEGIKAIFPYNFIVSMEFLCSGIQVFCSISGGTSQSWSHLWTKWTLWGIHFPCILLKTDPAAWSSSSLTCSFLKIICLIFLRGMMKTLVLLWQKKTIVNAPCDSQE